jgi:aspartyl-tRNA(Asn)/glutamyl-tRNA(Gln) amidotransferase subunit C
MALTLAEVEHIAKLARLELSEEEKNRFREQLSAILDYAARLQELDLTEIPPTSSLLLPSSLLPEQTRLRPDEPKPGLNQKELFRNAAEVENGQFRVPPVLG